MAQTNQLAGWPLGPGSDQVMGNYGGSAIAAGLAVKYDTSNPGGPNTPRGVVITSDSTLVIGITVDSIPALANGIAGTGKVRRAGMAVATASATIHVGQYVMSDSAGKVLPQTAGLFQTGIADSEALSGDSVLVWVAPAKNA